ncbi:MAG: SUMF1/EgtB/PvdO family nonheme iron enzyme [Cyanobacteriota bacterium]|nr:SUMF1/EgtB/PvdO family nonheme iron enzyme [Cyanobacteriota bacterium]
MASIFLSYTTRDEDGSGRLWSQRIAVWLREWGYDDVYLDKDPDSGTPAASDWRRVLHSRLAQCRAVIALCTPEYQASPWCMVEVGIALDRGRLVFPIHLGEEHLPGPLQHRQAIALDEAIALDPANADDAKQRLQRALTEKISWQEKLRWEPLGDSPPRPGRRPFHRCPFPGLKSYVASHAPVFFGRDQQITDLEALVRRKCNAGSGLLLLLGSSGCGKSSLLGAGLVPLLRQGERTGQPWLLLEPFRPLRNPFAQLNDRLTAAGVEPLPAMPRDDDPDAIERIKRIAAELLQRLDQLRSARPEVTVLLVIDQFEELLTYKADGFLRLLAALLRLDDNRVLVLASLRTDALARLEQHPSGLTRLRDATNDQVLLQPIAPGAFQELITKPLERLGRGIEPALLQALLKECASGAGDLLPLLSFTLQQLWEKQEHRWVSAEEEPPPWQDLLLADYITMEKLKGSVDKAAADSGWRLKADDHEGLLAVREAFLRHLVRLTEGDEPSRRQARRSELPPRSLAALDCLVNARLLVSTTASSTKAVAEEDTAKAMPNVSKDPTLEIAHEALLRTWPTLATWIEEGHEELLQRRRVKRLADDLSVAAAPRQRRQALEQLAALAAESPASGEHLAVRQEAAEPLAVLLIPPPEGEEPQPTASIDDRADAALILALIGAEEPLSACLAYETVPVELRRRAAESLGLLAKRSGDPEQRERIAAELEAVLRGAPLDLRVVDEASWKEHDKRLPLLQGAAEGLQLAASAELPLLGSGPGRVVPRLTLTALEKGGELRITTEVVEVEVWSLPLPEWEQLELVAIPGGEHTIGSPADERDKEAVLNWFAANRDGCRDPRTGEPLDVEAERRVELAPFWLVRHPISQRQWQAVVKVVEPVERELEASPGKAKPDSLWDLYGQPGELAVDSVSWNDSEEWLRRLNRWLSEQWLLLGGAGEPLQLALPGEGQWEAACRAQTATPFHFGDTLDARWAHYNATYVFGLGRKGPKGIQPGVNGGCGLVNRYGLAEMHGQLYEWCGDSWHPNPVGDGWRVDGLPWGGEDRDLAKRGSGQRGWKLLRGGSWIFDPLICRAAIRLSDFPDHDGTDIGLRPCCCPSPPGSLLGS